MPAVTITTEDLAPFASIPQPKAEAMIASTLARAARVAPCILLDTFEHAEAAKGILRDVILRWHESGAQVKTSQTAGIFGQTIDTGQQRRGLLWPSEVEELQELCRDASDGPVGIFAVDTVGAGSAHALVCAVNFGAVYCSCGADLTRYEYPLYGV